MNRATFWAVARSVIAPYCGCRRRQAAHRSRAASWRLSQRSRGGERSGDTTGVRAEQSPASQYAGQPPGDPQVLAALQTASHARPHSSCRFARSNGRASDARRERQVAGLCSATAGNRLSVETVDLHRVDSECVIGPHAFTYGRSRCGDGQGLSSFRGSLVWFVAQEL
jgi:hypothetical protein